MTSRTQRSCDKEICLQEGAGASFARRTGGHGNEAASELGSTLRARHLHQVHHPRAPRGGLGQRVSDPGRGQLHQGTDHRPWEAGEPRAPKRADYVLYYKPNIPIALIEAKDGGHAVGDGIQQALEYAESLEIPFVFSSNGTGFVLHDRTGHAPTREMTLALDDFPSPAALWERYSRWKGLTGEAQRVVLQDYHDDGSGKEPRYYQRNAVNAAVEAIAKGQDRSSSSWPPGRARHSRPSRSSGACGRRARRSGSCSSPTATS
jgi:hypothetical protein